ncbi:MAG: hypothetical protein U1F10_08510 [Burkholderiales bacterium]
MRVRRSIVVVLGYVACSCALAASSGSYTVTVGGTTVANDSKTFTGGGSGGTQWTNSGNNYGARAEVGVYPATALGLAQISATAVAQTSVTANSESSFDLNPPGRSFASVIGGKVVLHMKLAGNIVNASTIAGTANVQVLTFEGTANASASRTLADQPGPDSVEFEISIPFPAGLAADDFVSVSPRLALSLTASVPGGALQTASAEAMNSFRVAGFRVLNAAGTQVTGFTMTPRGYVPELPPVATGVARVVEYYNASYGFYFITALAQEIADLDSGKTPGWQRTGESFDVYTAPGANLAAVCRFYGVFGVKSSHFYAPRGLGCEALLPANPVWQYEGDVFFTYLPDANGGCPAGNVPVYRLYNNGQGGAPNHRFTTSASIQVQMMGAGWIPEGTGTGGGMCSPRQ